MLDCIQSIIRDLFMALTTVQIDLAALRHNLGLVRTAAPGRKIMAVVKANAYGHGLLDCAGALASAEGFAVTRIEEALLLRQHFPDHVILVLNPETTNDCWQACAQQAFSVVIHSEAAAHSLTESTLAQALPVWLKVDTGMHRLGITPESAHAVFNALDASPQVSHITWMTHLASADETHSPFTAQQLEVFNRVLHQQPAESSIANSAGVLAWPETHTEWVRPGIMLYGYDPLDTPNAISRQLKPVMTLSSEVVGIRDIKTGDSVGYNNRWKADRPSRIATIAIGYGDGYPRAAQDGTPVWINGQAVPLVGRVSMDLITADITGRTDINLGDAVELWGTSLHINHIAQCANTISYELTTRLTARPHRVLQD